ncbi:hypothetical protein C5H24_04365 [Xylella fastidiosa]|nr:hypothetical protein C5H25_02425 [Xylella fastidiosa]TNW04523.1 hypothetical protein C5H24_04365 [Xylella fastidiosa]TNW24001.1 hypothetical protein C5H12_03465 [Xylella fastidiosa]
MRLISRKCFSVLYLSVIKYDRTRIKIQEYCYLLSVICYLLSVICYLLSVICYLLSVICYLLSMSLGRDKAVRETVLLLRVPCNETL